MPLSSSSFSLMEEKEIQHSGAKRGNSASATKSRSTQGSNLEPPDHIIVVRRSAIEPADLLGNWWAGFQVRILCGNPSRTLDDSLTVTVPGGFVFQKAIALSNSNLL